MWNKIQANMLINEHASIIISDLNHVPSCKRQNGKEFPQPNRSVIWAHPSLMCTDLCEERSRAERQTQAKLLGKRKLMLAMRHCSLLRIRLPTPEYVWTQHVSSISNEMFSNRTGPRGKRRPGLMNSAADVNMSAKLWV